VIEGAIGPRQVAGVTGAEVGPGHAEATQVVARGLDPGGHDVDASQLAPGEGRREDAEDRPDAAARRSCSSRE
jgi:hypothetical protein